MTVKNRQSLSYVSGIAIIAGLIMLAQSGATPLLNSNNFNRFFTDFSVNSLFGLILFFFAVACLIQPMMRAVKRGMTLGYQLDGFIIAGCAAGCLYYSDSMRIIALCGIGAGAVIDILATRAKSAQSQTA